MNNQTDLLANVYNDITKEFPYACDYANCARRFVSPNALRMHIARTHTQTVKVRGQAQTEEQRHEQRLRHKRTYQKKLRDRYRREGRNSKGKWLVTPRKHGTTGLQWSPEQRAKFMATIRRKQIKGSSKRIRYVYPTPEEEIEQQQPVTLKRRMSHCPYCGENIQKHLGLENE
jgi:hypothetical protein